MSTIRETLFDLLLNTLLQIGFFAIVAALFSRILVKVRAKSQYIFYLVVFVFCLAAPVINTLWQSHPTAVAGGPVQKIVSGAGGSHYRFWNWQSDPWEHARFTSGPPFQSWIVGIWGMLVLYQLVHFGRGVYRVHRLRREASPVSAAQAGMASRIFEATHKITFFNLPPSTIQSL